MSLSSATVSITVTSANVAPVADDETAATPEDTPVTIDVLVGDTDGDGDPLTVTAIDGTAVAWASRSRSRTARSP